MRLIFILIATLVCANSSWADIALHEAAAKQVQKIVFGTDKPRLLQAISLTMGQSYSLEDKGVLLEVLESSELEALYVKNLMQTFSESELVALAEMMGSTAYRVYTERLPAFVQGFMPEARAYFKRSIPEFQRLAAEKRKLSGGVGQ